ncbi:hypothetical protein ACP4OV_020559 [Aristida adscensionis]
MDPNSSLGFSNSDSYISPLYEALRGTTVMPVVEEHALEIHQNPAPTPITNTIESAGFMQSLENQQEMMLAQHRFLTTTAINNISLFDRMQILSGEPPSFTSLLQGKPTALVHAHLDLNGVMDLGPIFYDPSSLTHKEEMMQNSLGSSSLCSPYGEMAQTSFAQSRASYFIKSEPELPTGVPCDIYDIVEATSSPISPEVGEARRVYPCKLCVAQFYSAQALGGHMSYHIKEMKKK